MNMQHLLHAAHAHFPFICSHKGTHMIVWCPYCGMLHIKGGTCCSHTRTHMHKNSKQSLLCSVPSRRTSAKIKPLWSKNTSRAREPKDWMEETTNTGERWGGWWWEGRRGGEREKKRGGKRRWDLFASILIRFKIQSRESAGNITLITFPKCIHQQPVTAGILLWKDNLLRYDFDICNQKQVFYLRS